MLRLLLLVTALIVYGSLFPFDFRPRPWSEPLDIMLASWPALGRYLVRDLAINVALYVPFGATLALALRRRLGSGSAVAVAVLAGAALSFGIEFTQIFVSSRTPSLFDWFCNSAGTVAGAALAVANRELLEDVFRRREGRGAPAPEAAILLAVSILYQLYPLFPSLSLTLLGQRLRHLMNTPVTLPDVLGETASWLAAGALASAVAPRHGRLAFGALLLLAPARLLIAGSGPTAAVFAGAALAGVAIFPRRQPPPARIVAGLLVLALIVRGLAPFQFLPVSHGFSLQPFAATLSSDWGSATHILLRKTFEYGALVWALVASGAAWAMAAGAAALLLGAIEVAQMWLPGRSAEITDPLLAVLIAFVLRSIRRAEKGRS